ncbi:MAG: TonB-dependent receptor [Deltaproteobacteria bacterium]|nr:TonB-dependent receptor [Kofleriaceae bacterium]
MNFNFWIAALLSACLAVAPPRALADEVIELTGEAPASTAPVHVVGRAAIERSNANTAADVLALVPGLAVDGPHNARDRNAHVRIRGFDARYTLVLVDGQRVTGKDTRGVVDLSTIPAGTIERIEVIKGPQAARFGGDAIGGVVNIVTRRAGEGTRAEAFAGYGSFDTRDVAGFFATRAGDVGVHVYARHEISDGWSDAYDLDRTLRMVTGKVDARGTDKSSVTASQTWERGADTIELAQRVHAGHDYKHKLSTRYVEEGTIEGETAVLELDGTARWTHRSASGDPWIASAYVARHGSEKHEHKDVVQRRSGRDVGRLEADELDEIAHWSAVAHGEHRRAAGRRHYLTAIVEWRSELRAADNHSVRTERDPDGLITGHADFRDPQRVYRVHEGIASLVVQDELTAGGAWAWQPAVRVDWHTAWGVQLAPSSAVAWRPSPRWIVRAATGLGWETPSIESRMISPVPDLDVPGDRHVVGNPDLVAERSLGNELSAQFRSDPDGLRRWRWSAGVSVFRNDFRDMIAKEIVDDYLGTGLPLEREVNLGRAVTQGAELAADLALGRRFFVAASYTRLLSRNGTTGAPLDRVAPHTATAQASWSERRTGTNVYAVARRVGAAPRLDGAGFPRPEGPLPALLVTQLRVEQRVARHVALSAQVDNVAGATWDKDADGDTDLPPPSLFVGAWGRF